jgi:isoleucyl-tRNA synthetase
MTRIPEVLDVWMDSGSMPYAQVHFPFAGFEDTNIKKAETNEEKTECFAFFENMWKEEFNMDFHNRQNITYDWIKEDFWNSTVFYLSE